jgi:hypothetical protein
MTMTDDLQHLALKHQRALGYPDVRETADFCANYVRLVTNRAPLAQDSLPIGMKAIGDRTMPQFRRRRTARDQLFQRDPDMGASLSDLTGGDEEPSFGSRVGEGLRKTGETINKASEATSRNTYTGTGHDQDPDDADFSPEDLMNILQLCGNKFGAQDDEDGDDRQDRLRRMLVAYLAAQRGNGAGDRRRMSRDQVPGSYASRSPDNGIGSYGPGSSGMDRRRRANDRAIAQDSAIAALNHRSFLKRYPGAARINTGGRF